MAEGLEVDITGGAGSFNLSAEFACDRGITGVFGHSGSGKTTLLKMIAGLVRPHSGRIAICGRVVYDGERGVDIPAHQRRTGFVFQDGRLFPHMTVEKNLTFANRHGHGAGERGLDEVVTLLGLEAMMARQPQSLSGGERQRVAIGRALLSDPQLLLMDEPLSSLDHARRQEVLPYLERLREETRIPIVYVSHEIDEVVRLADALVVLSRGEVLASGPAAEMFGRIDLGPALGRHEAGAIIEGMVCAVDAQYGLVSVDLGGAVIELAADNLAVGARVRMRIRARDVALARQRPEGISIRNCLDVRVIEIKRDGDRFAELALDLSGQVLRARVTAKSLDQLRITGGDRIFALLKAISVERRALAHADHAPAGAGKE